MKIASIVEGDGEVAALPILLRRLNARYTPEHWFDPLRPIRVRRDRFLNREEEFRRQLLLAAAKSGEAGWILILLDADDDCPAELARCTLDRARQYVGDRKLSVVLANREYEAWFIAAAASLDGVRGLTLPLAEHDMDAELPRDAKGWLNKRMAGAYNPILDQPALSQVFNLDEAHSRSRSFRKLCREWEKHCTTQTAG